MLLNVSSPPRRVCAAPYAEAYRRSLDRCTALRLMHYPTFMGSQTGAVRSTYDRRGLEASRLSHELCVTEWDGLPRGELTTRS
ncbi:hypothetical protein EVAR_83411_1 [Eumeta japonica]|uniref:Uncharacterized protein n=1 Tax=Eumeta variegata TaxID=151549 RepID=A0A4C1TYU1_EUMVA|nr:hypothetical protein EVAR_83411_1 [Eumeta japonica]